MVDKEKVLFSVLIPIYNEETFLSDCIESILGQDELDYEVILVDDGSFDRSPEICDSYAKNVSNIKVIHKNNEGLFLARKTGIENAKGEYLLFLDSDDAFRSDTLRLLKQCIDSTRSDIILFNASIYHDYKVPLLEIPFYDKQVFENDQKVELYKTLCSSHKLNNLCFKCVKRDIVDLNIYNCSTGISYGEDLFQSISFFDAAKKITYLNHNLYYYRQRENSMTHMYSSKQLESIFAVFAKLVDYAEKWGKEKEFDFVSFTNKYAGQECYSITKNIIGAISDYRTKEENLYQWYSSEFYQKYNKYAYSELQGKRIVLYWLMRCRLKPINYIVHKLFSFKSSERWQRFYKKN